jgi:hypothetical protein
MTRKIDELTARTLRLRQLRLVREKEGVRPQREPQSRRDKLWGLDDELTFGKNKGFTIRQVIENDRRWLIWMLENTEHFELDRDATAELEASADSRRPPRAWE